MEVSFLADLVGRCAHWVTLRKKSECTLPFLPLFSTGTKHLPLLAPARIWPTMIDGDTGNRIPRLAQALDAAAGPLEFAATSQGTDLRFAGQRTLVDVYRKGELAQIHSAQGAT
jgi:hypothetical protein